MDAPSLLEAARRTGEYLSKLDQSATFLFGRREVSVADLAASVSRLAEIFENEDDPVKRTRTIRREFDLYRAAGDAAGSTLVTGYYQPLLRGSRTPDDVYIWPIYRRPGDIVSVDLGQFSDALKGKRIAGRVDGGRLVPYYDREHIDGANELEGRGLEIAWVDDPVDLFFLHVQGSGIVRFEDGTEIFVNYAGANGREYSSIGRLLIDEGEIAKEDMSLQAIREWFARRPDQIERVLYSNPSYVFFREMEDGPFGATGVKLVPGRSAAFDPSCFPRGGLAHITVELPVIEQGRVTGWRKTGRFVFSHDTGGAIKGAGRMDLFFGAGRDAETAAGVMKNPGELTFLVLKPDQIQQAAAR